MEHIDGVDVLGYAPRVVCAATDAEFQNRLMARNQTLNLPVVERQPTPIPTACRTLRSGLDPGSPPKRALARYGHDGCSRTEEKKKNISDFFSRVCTFGFRNNARQFF